ncbi:MAG: Panacea domain-containing protein [bacterium]
MAIDVMKIAKWFIKKGLDQPRNTIDGNMKLQKLLYFSQLISLAIYNKPLFNDPIYAFKNGSVVEKVRLKYKNDHREFIKEAEKDTFEFNDKEQKVIDLATGIFGGAGARELSKLNHTHYSWKKAYENSIFNGVPLKNNSTISLDDIRKYDLEKIKEIIEAYKIDEKQSLKCEVINGIEFYYDPSEINLTEELIEELETYDKEESYTIYKDPSLGMVVY